MLRQRPARLRTLLSLWLPCAALLHCGSGAPTDPGATTPENPTGADQCSKPSTTLIGVDVSHYDGNIDWVAAKEAGVVYAFAKVSEGIDVVDATFAGNWTKMKDAGVVRGAYQFFHPKDDVGTQMNLMFDLIDKAGGLADDDLPVALDVETNDGLGASAAAAAVLAAISAMQQHTGRTPVVYSSKRVWQGMLGNPSTDAHLWVVDYQSTTCPILPPAFADWSFWQHTDAGHVSGIAAGVDMNLFNGDLDALHAL